MGWLESATTGKSGGLRKVPEEIVRLPSRNSELPRQGIPQFLAVRSSMDGGVLDHPCIRRKRILLAVLLAGRSLKAAEEPVSCDNPPIRLCVLRQCQP